MSNAFKSLTKTITVQLVSDTDGYVIEEDVNENSYYTVIKCPQSCNSKSIISIIDKITHRSGFKVINPLEVTDGEVLGIFSFEDSINITFTYNSSCQHATIRCKNALAIEYRQSMIDLGKTLCAIIIAKTDGALISQNYSDFNYRASINFYNQDVDSIIGLINQICHTIECRMISPWVKIGDNLSCRYLLDNTDVCFYIKNSINQVSFELKGNL